MDTFSKSDPVVAVYMKGNCDTTYREIGRTEMIKDNLNPAFTTPIETDYRFEELQKLKFVVVDVDDETGRIESQDLIGEVETTLGDVVASSEFREEIKLKDRPKEKRGVLIVTSEEVKQSQSDIVLEFSATKVDKKDFFGKSDPFLVFNQVTPNGQLVPVHKTEVVKVTLNPHWKKFTIPLYQLCNCELERSIEIQCFDWNRSGKMDFIGSARTTASELVDTKSPFPRKFPLLNEKKQKKGKNPESGTLNHLYTEVFRRYSFLEYLQGGCSIGLIVGIDFTGSNGDPKSPSSLHYINKSGGMNQYMEAIWSVGQILACYDADKLFPVYGFGAKLPDGTISHCFPLNGNAENPSVFGVDGILQAYTHSLSFVQLWGPTNFAPIIRAAAAAARAASMQPGTQQYTILLMLTDGAITDLQMTKDALVEAAETPLSIIIVGIGNANFDSMEELDGDEVPVRSSKGITVSRDIVQFVPFNKYKTNPAALAAEVLMEVPTQLTQYYQQRHIPPCNVPDSVALDVLQGNLQSMGSMGMMAAAQMAAGAQMEALINQHLESQQ